MDKQTFIRMIFLFSIFTPLGIVIGMALTAASKLVEAIFISISTGTFLYVACSEVIVEEFAISKNRFIKYLAFIMGGLLIVGITFFEVYTES